MHLITGIIIVVAASGLGVVALWARELHCEHRGFDSGRANRALWLSRFFLAAALFVAMFAFRG